MFVNDVVKKRKKKIYLSFITLWAHVVMFGHFSDYHLDIFKVLSSLWFKRISYVLGDCCLEPISFLYKYLVFSFISGQYVPYYYN